MREYGLWERFGNVSLPLLRSCPSHFTLKPSQQCPALIYYINSTSQVQSGEGGSMSWPRVARAAGHRCRPARQEALERLVSWIQTFIRLWQHLTTGYSICNKFHWNPSTTLRDIASRVTRVHGQQTYDGTTGKHNASPPVIVGGIKVRKQRYHSTQSPIINYLQQSRIFSRRSLFEVTRGRHQLVGVIQCTLDSTEHFIS